MRFVFASRNCRRATSAAIIAIPIVPNAAIAVTQVPSAVHASALTGGLCLGASPLDGMWLPGAVSFDRLMRRGWDLTWGGSDGADEAADRNQCE